MAKEVKIIMYHYVRKIRNSRYSGIKGLESGLFMSQLDYIRKNYQIINMQDLIASLKYADALPRNAALLTFDDGYIDHFSCVFPALDKLKLQGCFFIPAKPIKEHSVLNVNKIHFILATVENKIQLVKEIYSILDDYRSEYGLKSNEQYFRETAVSSRFDTKETVFIKRMLQRELPDTLRNIILNRLFAKYVTADEASFAGELYMSIDQIKCMRERGMYIGNHGYGHYWMDTLDRPDQEREIGRSLEFLRDVGCVLNDWVISYPYGAYDESLISVVKSRGCAMGLTTEPRAAELEKDNIFALPRLDTNDLPKGG